MPPPDKRAKCKLVAADEVFGIIQILIGTIPQVLALDQLMERWIEAWRGGEREACEVLLQGIVRCFKLGSYFCRDRSLSSKELGIGQQGSFIIGEQHWMGHHERDVKG